MDSNLILSTITWIFSFNVLAFLTLSFNVCTDWLTPVSFSSFAKTFLITDLTLSKPVFVISLLVLKASLNAFST